MKHASMRRAVAVAVALAAVCGPVDAAEEHFVNQHAFPVSVVVDAIGPSGVERLELWVSGDNRATWDKVKSMSRVTNRKIRVPFKTDKDGTYHFLTVSNFKLMSLRETQTWPSWEERLKSSTPEGIRYMRCITL